MPSSAPLYNETANSNRKYEKKTCNSCRESISIGNFTRNKRNRDGYDNRCKKCTVEYYKQLAKRHAIALGETIDKVCTKCKIVKPVSCFYKASWSADGRHPRCKDCHSFDAAERWKENPRATVINRKKNKEWRDANKPYLIEKSKGKNYSYYGVTKEWYESKFVAQNGKCDLCGIPYEFSGKKRMSIDHNHDCCPTGRGCDKCRRGLLCTKCNTRLGVLEISGWVKQAKSYLKKYPLKNKAVDTVPSLFDFMEL